MTVAVMQRGANRSPLSLPLSQPRQQQQQQQQRRRHERSKASEAACVCAKATAADACSHSCSILCPSRLIARASTDDRRRSLTHWVGTSLLLSRLRRLFRVGVPARDMQEDRRGRHEEGRDEGDRRRTGADSRLHVPPFFTSVSLAITMFSLVSSSCLPVVQSTVD